MNQYRLIRWLKNMVLPLSSHPGAFAPWVLIKATRMML